MSKNGFTLTEVLVAVVIVGVIAALVLPSVVSHYQENSFQQAYKRETQTIQSAVEGLAVNENKSSFFETMMYTNEEPTTYTDSAEKFIKTYLRPSKLCGDNNGDCFATRYYEYKDNDKKVYTPTYKGSCAKLKNGASICLTPQTGAQAIEGLIDINGTKSPNVLGKDLRTFTIDVQTRAGRNTEVAAVLETEFTPIQDGEDPCEGKTCGCGTLPDCDPCEGQTCGCGTLPDCPPDCSSNSNEWDLTCCEANLSSITSNTHHCCTFDSIKNSNATCKPKMYLYISCANYVNSSTNEIKCSFSLSNNYKFSDMTKDIKMSLLYGSFQSDVSASMNVTPYCERIQQIYESESCVNHSYCGHVTSPVSYGSQVEYTLSRTTPGSSIMVTFTNGTEHMCMSSSISKTKICANGSCTNGSGIVIYNP